MCVNASVRVHSVPVESEESSVSSLFFHPRSGCAEASLRIVESTIDPDLHQEDVDPAVKDSQNLSVSTAILSL